MTEIVREAARLTKSAPLELFRFDTSSLGGPVMFFCQTAAQSGIEGVSFGGVTYTPVDVVFEGMETTTSGSLPRPTIQIASSNGVIQSIINTYGDLRGCILQRVRTFAKFLDGEPAADPTMYFGPDTFRVHRKISEGPVFVQWELSAAIDQEGKMLPGRQIIRDTCSWRYRQHIAGTNSFDYAKVHCPYTGSDFFTKAAVSTEDPALDRCGRKVSDCELRFGVGNPLPFGGFPGAARVRR